MHIFIWISTALLLALWSLLAWGLHALLALDPSWVGDLKPLIAQIPFGPLIDAWVPGWSEMLQWTLDLAQTGLQWTGSAAPWIVGALWAAGALALLLLGGFFSLLVVLLSRAGKPPVMRAPGAV